MTLELVDLAEAELGYRTDAAAAELRSFDAALRQRDYADLRMAERAEARHYGQVGRRSQAAGHARRYLRLPPAVHWQVMSERFWLLEIGPLDEQGVVEWVDRLDGRAPGAPDVKVIDHRHWYATAMDAASVRNALEVLRAGIADSELTEEVRWSVRGLIDDMEHWLAREFDPPQG